MNIILVVENDDCRYNSPAFLVRKRDRTMRMVVDYRRINKLIKPIIVALPGIDDLFNEIAASNPQFISTTDFFKGYYNVKLGPKYNCLTAFTNPKTGVSSKYQCLPFGLNVSTAGFLYIMALMFKNKQKFSYCWYYVDDLICRSKTFEDHLEHLRNVFATIKTNNLSINITKTMSAFREVEFLGHQVTSECIKISPTKIKVIQNIFPPKNCKSLQRVLGLLSIFASTLQAIVNEQPPCGDCSNQTQNSSGPKPVTQNFKT